VINADGNTFTSPAHPGAIFDTVTHLLWLDATETKGRSLADVTSKLGVGQEFEGWQLASITQIDQLFANAGLLDTNHSFMSNSSAQADVISFVGMYGQTNDEQGLALMGTNIWHADSFFNTAIQGLISALWISTDDRYWVGRNGTNYEMAVTGYPGSGVALVRAIPEPSSLALLTLAVPALLRRQCRHRRREIH
jgi:hypothetical protein